MAQLLKINRHYLNLDNVTDIQVKKDGTVEVYGQPNNEELENYLIRAYEGEEAQALLFYLMNNSIDVMQIFRKSIEDETEPPYEEPYPDIPF